MLQYVVLFSAFSQNAAATLCIYCIFPKIVHGALGGVGMMYVRCGPALVFCDFYLVELHPISDGSSIIKQPNMYSGAKKYLVSHRLCNFSHLKG